MSDDLIHRVIAYLHDVAGGTEHREKAEALADELAAAPQPALLLSEEEREAINEGAMALNREAARYEHQADYLGDTFATSDGYKTYRELERRKRRQSDVLLRLATAAPADSVAVRREVALKEAVLAAYRAGHSHTVGGRYQWCDQGGREVVEEIIVEAIAAALNAAEKRDAERKLLKDAADMLSRTYICGERICCQYCDATAVGRTKHDKHCEYGSWLAAYAALQAEK